MSDAAQAEIRELKQRIAEIEWQVEYLMTSIEEHWTRAFLDAVPQEAFQRLLRHLEILVPDFSGLNLRRDVEGAMNEALDKGEAKDPKGAAPVWAWKRARCQEIIEIMFSGSHYEGGDFLEDPPSAHHELLSRRLERFSEMP